MKGTPHAGQQLVLIEPVQIAGWDLVVMDTTFNKRARRDSFGIVTRSIVVRLDWWTTVILHISLAIVCYALPLSGEMCSAIIPNTEGETKTILQKKTVLAFRSNCRQPEKYRCEYLTEPSIPQTFRYIMGPLSMPFKLDFEVKSKGGIMIALFEKNTNESIFAEINIGGWGGDKSVIRACYSYICKDLFGEYNEPAGRSTVDEFEFRPFWIEYTEGVVSVGKGGQQTAFSKWDAGAYYGRVTSEVYIGISAALFYADSWVFNTPYICK
ncbi:uncharacterized protein [Asterias amurensis]|uniref:uncharacterized protein n=1 Tax=Asterias amurensis TaxID=7602 RepID=UPI003AB627FA